MGGEVTGSRTAWDFLDSHPISVVHRRPVPAVASWEPAVPVSREPSISWFLKASQSKKTFTAAIPQVGKLRHWKIQWLLWAHTSKQMSQVQPLPIQLRSFSCWKCQPTTDISERILLRLICSDRSNEINLLSCMCYSTVLHSLVQKCSCPRVSKCSADIKVQTQQSAETYLWILWDNLTWLWCILSTLLSAGCF